MARRKDTESKPPPVKDILAAFNASIPELPRPEPPPAEFTPAIPHHLIRKLKLVHGEAMARQFEALRLFEPLPEQDRFLKSTAKIRIYRGGNRAGKTTIGAVECALAMTGTGGWHGYYPRSGVNFMVVAWDMRDTGLVLYRALFEEGQIKVIYDPELKKTRAFRPWAQWDRAYVEKRRDGPPMIPERFVQSTAWVKANERQPSMIRMVNGSELLFFSGLGMPRKGLKLHGAWTDEEIPGVWLTEIQARLIDYAGLFYWTATPQNGTAELLNLLEWADQEEERAREDQVDRSKREAMGIKNQNPPYEPKCVSFLMGQTDNPHLPSEGTSQFAAAVTALADDENDLDVRVHGDTVNSGNRVFPEFSERGPHSISPSELPGGREDEFVVPPHWTRYLIVDPGRACAGTLFVVPPPEEPIHGGHVYGADEIYIGQSDASQLASRAKPWFDEGTIERMWMDMHFGRQTRSEGRTEAWYYEQEFKKLGLACRQTKFQFEEAPGERKEGIEAIRSWLRRLPDGFPKYRIMYIKKRRFENFVKQMRRFQYKLDAQKRPTNEPDFRRCDTIDVLRYAARLDLKYVPPQTSGVGQPADYAVAMAAKVKSWQAGQAGLLTHTVHLGPQGLWKP